MPRIFALVESPGRGKEFGVQRAFVEMITRVDVTRRGYRTETTPAYDIDQSVSLVSLNINYYCLLDTFQQPSRKYYVHVRRDKHDNPVILSAYCGYYARAVAGCRLSRITKT